MREFNAAVPASDAEIEQFSAAAGLDLPRDDLDFMRIMKGGEGLIGQSYVMLWPVDELLELNEAYQVADYAPGLFLFGSSGGGEAFAFDMRNADRRVVAVPFIGMNLSLADAVAPQPYGVYPYAREIMRFERVAAC